MNNVLINKHFLLISCLLASISAVCADEKTAVEELAVWGTRVYSSSVGLDEESIAIKQSDHLSDLLRTIPGVDVGGAHSLNQRITIRSMDDKDLRISIDGAYQNTYMYHHMGNLQIHADILQSVDIEVGNNSVLNGGLGGAVRFETREAKDLLPYGQSFGGRIHVSSADNASSNYSISGYGQLDDSVDVLLYYNAVDRDNYEVGGGRILDETGAEISGTDGKVRGLEGELTDGLFKLGWDITDSQRIKIGYESYLDEGDYSYRPDMGLATDLAIAGFLNIPLVYPTEFTRDTITLNYDLSISEHTTLKAAWFENESTLWRDETGLASWNPAFAVVVEGEATNSGFNVYANTKAGDSIEHSLTYGVDIINYETAYNTDGVFQSGEEATSRALFIEDRISFANGLILTPGLRNDNYDIESVAVDDSFSDSTLSLAIGYQIDDDVLIELSSTELFKGPEIGEVFIGAGLFDTPNPDIKAETGTNSEFSVVQRTEGFETGFTIFKTKIENYIYDYAANPSGGFWKDNVGTMEIDGIEAYAEIEQGAWHALLTYSTAESRLSATADYIALDGARIDRQQGDTVSFNLDYRFASADVVIHWDILMVDDVAAGLDLDGATLDNAKDNYSVHNFSVRWVPGGNPEGFAFTFGIDNVFDEFYASQSSRTGTSFHPLFQELYLFDYEPGRNMKATVSYQF